VPDCGVLGTRRASARQPEVAVVLRYTRTAADDRTEPNVSLVNTARVSPSALAASLLPNHWCEEVGGFRYPMATSCSPSTPTWLDAVHPDGLQALT
jgi:hypothetical protein